MIFLHWLRGTLFDLKSLQKTRFLFAALFIVVFRKVPCRAGKKVPGIQGMPRGPGSFVTYGIHVRKNAKSLFFFFENPKPVSRSDK